MKWHEQLRDLRKGATRILYHIAVVTLSAGFALSLPFVVDFTAQNFMGYWSRIENDKGALITIEIATAIFLIASFAYLRRSTHDRRLAEMAAEAGLLHFFPAKGRLAKRKIRKLKEKHGLVRNIMLIGATGGRTFVNPRGDLHHVLSSCLEAKIMLMNPCGEGARARARTMRHPDATLEAFGVQIKESIDFLKKLRAPHKNVRLKLYSDIPHLKLAILGDNIWVQHYHTSLDVLTMPEYVFRHNRNGHGLYALFYHYFRKRWERPDMPEYDLETDELVYRGFNGNETRREPFGIDVEGEDRLVTGSKNLA